MKTPKTAKEYPAMLNETEVSEILGIALPTLRTWRSVKRYNLIYMKIGRCVRYRLSDVLAFAASREVSGGGE